MELWKQNEGKEEERDKISHLNEPLESIVNTTPPKLTVLALCACKMLGSRSTRSKIRGVRIVSGGLLN